MLRYAIPSIQSRWNSGAPTWRGVVTAAGCCYCCWVLLLLLGVVTAAGCWCFCGWWSVTGVEVVIVTRWYPFGHTNPSCCWPVLACSLTDAHFHWRDSCITHWRDSCITHWRDSCITDSTHRNRTNIQELTSDDTALLRKNRIMTFSPCVWMHGLQNAVHSRLFFSNCNTCLRNDVPWSQQPVIWFSIYCIIISCVKSVHF